MAAWHASSGLTQNTDLLMIDQYVLSCKSSLNMSGGADTSASTRLVFNVAAAGFVFEDRATLVAAVPVSISIQSIGWPHLKQIMLHASTHQWVTPKTDSMSKSCKAPIIIVLAPSKHEAYFWNIEHTYWLVTPTGPGWKISPPAGTKLKDLAQDQAGKVDGPLLHLCKAMKLSVVLQFTLLQFVWEWI